MTVLGIIPARGGSKRVVNKNVKLLCGKPLIAWTIEVALASKHITELVVSSDDPNILSIAAEFGTTPLKRPVELAQDDTPTLPVLQHAVQWAEWAAEGPYDIIAHLPCTNPLKTTEDLDDAFDELLKADSIESVIGVNRVQGHHPARVKKMVNGLYLRDFCMPEPQAGQRQLLEPHAYIRNGAFYLVRRDALMGLDEQPGKLFDHFYGKGFVMPDERSVNIYTQLDFMLCELLLQQRSNP